MKKLFSMLTATALLLSLAACNSNTQGGSSSGGTSSQAVPDGSALVLSDDKVTLDGQEVTDEGAVTVSHDIVYYESGKGSDYGEGSAEEEHTAQEAAAHTVVTICEPGTYIVSGALSTGQLAIDLGEDAKTDPNAVVTVVLDGVDITSTVGPALIFYSVYECDTDWVAYDESDSEETYRGTSDVDTAAAGANVVLADDSENNVTGSHVARIYKEGTTKKLHKYDGAFYSKMSMNISGGSAGTGKLNIIADNEGLDSEMHLTVNGGVISIQAQDDGINTNEDYVSVTTINGGTLQINGGLGTEGDGIDSNGHLVINGGNIYTMANERSPDGGIDADGDIIINGGYLVALGTRNDAVGSSTQPYMELFFASTLPAGSNIVITSSNGDNLLNFTTEKASQCLTFSSADLKENDGLTVTVDGVTQQYTGNQSGGFGGMGQMPDGIGGFGGRNQEIPDELEAWLASAEDVPDEVRTWLEAMMTQQENMDNMGGGRPGGDMGEMPTDQQGENTDAQQSFGQGGDVPDAPSGEMPNMPSQGQTGGTASSGGQRTTSTPSTAFTITATTHTFSGVTDSTEDGDKTEITFSINGNDGPTVEDGAIVISSITPSEEIDQSRVQITITDVPSEDFAATALLSDGLDSLKELLPTDSGTYRITVSVSGDDSFTGINQWTVTIPETAA